MKHLLWILMLCNAALYANLPPGQWKCFAMDAKGKTYIAVAKTEADAINAAKSQCYNFSHTRNCRSAQSFCEQVPIYGECLVTDDDGRAWDAKGQNPCRIAKYLCTEWQFLNGISSSQCIVRHRVE